jgi:small conductance mechanosensitive channel
MTTKTVIRWMFISTLTFGIILGWSMIERVPPALSQLPSLQTGTSQNPFSPPSGVTRYGEYETAPVKSPLDGRVLFEVTSPTIFNRDNIPEDKTPVETRAETINQRLLRIFGRITNAKQMPTVAIATLNNRPILQVTDNLSSRPVRLVTVTEPDADYQSKTLEELAQEWQKILQEETVRIKQLASPEVFFQRLEEGFQTLLGLLIASGVIWFLRRQLTRRKQTLEAHYQQELTVASEVEKTRTVTEATAPTNPIEADETESRVIKELRSQLLTKLQRQFSVKQRLDIDKFLKWALFWTFVLTWYIGIYQIMSRVPVLMRWSRQVLATPLELIVIWFVVSFAIRICKSLIDRFIHSWKINPFLPLEETQRTHLRTASIAGALKGLATFVLMIVGIIWTLNLFNIPTSSILAGGAVIGLAISFGSQSLIKDLVNGCLVLIEDQFAVGDVIEIGDKGGLVENLNLRVTQLRNGEGQLITIPNSNITDVRNLTRLWSRVDFSIVVAYENDPKQVLDVLKQVSKQLYSEPEWRDRLPETPEVLGIDDLSHTGMLVRVWIKTAPMEQWSVGREFRLRVRQAFAAHHIQIGRPQWITYRADLVTVDGVPAHPSDQ